jgi:hypothetical protein
MSHATFESFVAGVGSVDAGDPIKLQHGAKQDPTHLSHHHGCLPFHNAQVLALQRCIYLLAAMKQIVPCLPDSASEIPRGKNVERERALLELTTWNLSPMTSPSMQPQLSLIDMYPYPLTLLLRGSFKFTSAIKRA